jgi:hypothetical protein
MGVSKVSQKKTSFDVWLESLGPVAIASTFKIDTATVRGWMARHNYPRVEHMKRIQRLSHNAVTYADIIDRGVITKKKNVD